ncbi:MULTISPECIES: helix-turn-helix domain-containing protein [unclassified Streptomyces]|uniref:helix-turn-helix domain-containing protein n=1 Tax=unclassified Streptomyces TaxID=2593676 RepID=UPI00225325A4|nr:MULTISPECIES: helix-turn-helix domain-containing protein [unclassified Streptomyces]MCX4880093.1 helix-turn-helix domain-containing protein [Streptomyces sp. NBC_00847]MCX5420089.1 helix-turn-helix domain-containing protein [Streptomyces sp. NBC_00078]
MAAPPNTNPRSPGWKHIPYPNHGRYALGAERERYAKIAAERYAAGASIHEIADELGRSRSFVNGLLHRDTDVEVRPRSVPRRLVSGT